jgi:hypothetical protein
MLYWATLAVQAFTAPWDQVEPAPEIGAKDPAIAAVDGRLPPNDAIAPIRTTTASLLAQR